MPDETRRKIILSITGMTCDSCADTIERGLSSMPGVSRVNINPAS
ncbi:MAG: heavy-metal-associated domain-containing protein [Dehalococcoidia bacterium]|nr:Copper-exporting P-type ATPase A [Chloroflexota bacterium]MBT9159249.1 Copper-exporting P-type ATPase A [Chloroflexota bacterium]MBT9161650.1 Copper-exporting P-type ATPase A [Chloroflexota bacterium]